ncbi:MAG: hypothetical protein A2015_08855 [Spirochaetes bacterium GWF1_31_7]|nr:MAG: hypothetical protein A2Y30_06805 [Spirochaetes bacterium GWE1_32_154]OHD48029.1 MAG: hypothetical protein A2015_08855 [Spirochaetes bacterium GWF1_31_7]OHD49654.1 MAG: hypothetical protein A2Y29_06780 [Spirochaetes bacterium GWE2_31_10]OHD80062.1 MAG: hypothetical protein A2355_09415 [Spirochaetes bacterium RIFOXYB1_FULL_32_8]HBD96207.1 hypothetical protein [Spirochaetia bacterium]
MVEVININDGVIVKISKSATIECIAEVIEKIEAVQQLEIKGIQFDLRDVTKYDLCFLQFIFCLNKQCNHKNISMSFMELEKCSELSRISSIVGLDISRLARV